MKCHKVATETSVSEMFLSEIGKSLKTWAGAVKDLLNMLTSLAKEMGKGFARAAKLIQAVEE